MVSSKKYKEVLKERNLYQEFYYDEQRLTNDLRCKIISLNNEIRELCEINARIVNRSEDYKRKFLDEQQKRLELAEIVERLETKINDVDRSDYINENPN